MTHIFSACIQDREWLDVWPMHSMQPFLQQISAAHTCQGSKQAIRSFCKDVQGPKAANFGSRLPFLRIEQGL